VVLKTTKQFKKDRKRVEKQGKDMTKLDAVVMLLLEEKELPKRYNVHALTGNLLGYFDLHIEPDWLLIYTYTEDDDLELVELKLVMTGSHSHLFG